MRRASSALLALTLGSGCAAPPEVDVARFAGRVPAASEGYPALRPIEAAPPRRATAPQALGDALEARASALRARAGALRGPVIPEPERGRLDDARP